MLVRRRKSNISRQAKKQTKCPNETFRAMNSSLFEDKIENCLLILFYFVLMLTVVMTFLSSTILYKSRTFGRLLTLQ